MRIPAALALIAALAAAEVAAAHDGAPHGKAPAPPAAGRDVLPIPGLGGPFALIDHRGAPRTDRDFRGKLMLVLFGFTQCPEVCGLELQTVAAALDRLGARAEDVAPLFISVDPETDTPDVLARFVGGFHPALIGLTGAPAAIGQALKAYRAHAAVLPPGSPQRAAHTTFIYLMNREGRFLTLMPADTTAEDVAARVAKYL